MVQAASVRHLWWLLQAQLAIINTDFFLTPFFLYFRSLVFVGTHFGGTQEAYFLWELICYPNWKEYVKKNHLFILFFYGTCSLDQL